jgi:hypothetical protein
MVVIIAISCAKPQAAKENQCPLDTDGNLAFNT